MIIRRGDIVYLKDTAVKPTNMRPFLIVSNDTGNKHGNIVIGIPLTTKHKKLNQPTHCLIDFNDSMVLAEQIYTISKDDVNRIIGRVNEGDLERVDACVRVSLALNKTNGRYYGETD